MSSGLEQRQQDLLAEMHVDRIPRGASVPIELFTTELSPSAPVAEFGIGNAQKAALLTKHGFVVVGFDINPHAVESARKTYGIPSHVINVADPDVLLRDHSLLKPEAFKGVVMEGLLCNLMGADVSNTIVVASKVLAPGGKLFIADVLAATEDHPTLVDVLRQVLGSDEYDRWSSSWERRYRANEDLGLLPYHFVVARLGSGKELEWQDAQGLRALLGSPDFERYARHLTEGELFEALGRCGMKNKSYQYTLWRSRTNAVLAGFVGVWEKIS